VYSDDYRRARGVDAAVLPAEPVEVSYGTVVERWSFSRPHP
jgi:hypothetical protein